VQVNGDSEVRVLLVEDDRFGVELVQQVMRKGSGFRFELVHVSDLASAMDVLGREPIGLVLLDLSLPDSAGPQTLARLRDRFPEVAVVVLTGMESDALGVELIQMGAQDYLVKGQVGGRELCRCLSHARVRHRAERDLQRMRLEALAVARAKSDFLAAMSHEIRTPLNAILGMAELLSDTSLDGDQSHYVKVFWNAGQSLLELINGILDLSKIEAGRLELDVGAFDLELLLDSTLEILAFSAHKKGLALTHEIDPRVPRVLEGDAARIRQVLINLIGNAIKFTERGEVVLAVGPAPGSAPGDLLFSVRDTGIGIPADKVATIFESFSQLDTSGSGSLRGTGLGLSLCKQLVELMGGRIWAESELGRESVFRFTARLGVHASSSAPEPPAVHSAASGRALVACKHEGERRILTRMLERMGYRATPAASTSEALSRIRETTPGEGAFDLVLLDCRFPERGGFAVVEACEDRRDLRGRVVMLLPSDHRPGDIAQCEEQGLLGWTIKPVVRAALTELLARASGRRGAGGLSPALPEAGGEACRILLADDCADNRELVVAYLRSSPHAVECVENGARALERFKAEPFDLVLMDMQMPVMDGYSAVKAIRDWEALRGRSPTPILALTAYAFMEEREQTLRAGCNAHVTKPVRKRDLLEAIRTHAPRGAARPERAGVHGHSVA
jgi:two-component system sensor histidine kinase/response regulator